MRVAFLKLIDAVRLTTGMSGHSTESFIWLLEGQDEFDTVFLLIKEARQSVLEPFLGTSNCPNSGQRVVTGQQWMQSSYDPFLGWFHCDDGRDYYARDARALQGRPVLETMTASELIQYAEACGSALARAHARTGDRIQIAAYLGEGKSFDRAVAGCCHSSGELSNAALLRQPTLDAPPSS